MDLDDFVKQSLGVWKSLRSGHSLAFKQIEEINSIISIRELSPIEPEVEYLLQLHGYNKYNVSCPFQIEWEVDSNWDNKSDSSISSGSSIFLPIPSSKNNGLILRSMGYTEKIRSISQYRFLNDGTFVLSTKYEKSIVEERIWFISNNVRCRSSVIQSIESNGVLQLSFASEIRNIKEV